MRRSERTAFGYDAGPQQPNGVVDRRFRADAGDIDQGRHIRWTRLLQLVFAGIVAATVHLGDTFALACDPATEVSIGGACYYLDGSTGVCDPGYVLGSQTVLTNGLFAGKTYKHTVSSNCCIFNADPFEDWGMQDHCNAPGTFTAGDPQLGAVGCTLQTNFFPGQLTLCKSVGGSCGNAIDGFAPAGSACGSFIDSACDNPDTCDGAGTCQPNVATAGSACGSFIDSACDNPDACDGAGACQPNFATAGSACGSFIDSACDNPDSCNGAGACQPNYEAVTTNCGDAGTQCTHQDNCNGSGACADNGFVTPGSACGSFTDNECDNPDSCNGAGTCQPNFEPVTTNCGDAGTQCTNQDNCNGGGACTDNGFKPSTTPCNDSDACTQTDGCNGGGTCVGSNPVVCTALDQCHVAGVCNMTSGLCSNPNKPDGQVCDDTNVCTQQDSCQNGVCIGNNTGADTDGDGYCDFQETQAGCDPTDSAEIPPQSVTFGGLPSEHSLGANGLISYDAPAGSGQKATVSRATDASCATSGVCAPTQFCTAGKINDPCTTNAQCDQPANTCRMVINYGNVPDLSLTVARLGRTDILTNFQPVTPGCSRKVQLSIDPALSKPKLRLRATGTLSGRVRRDNDRFVYGP